MKMIDLAEKGWMPDTLIRYGIRRLCEERLRDENIRMVETNGEIFQQQLNKLRVSPIAIDTDAANQQHYEVPAAFYRLVLGEHLKYSCCWWDSAANTLDLAEAAMLELYDSRAELADGQTILELGCGWGSLTLWMANRYPNSQIVAVSNSQSQRQYIENQALQRGLSNIEIITCDVNKLQLTRRFDRVVSIEMFEHMRNYQRLLHNISGWLTDHGKLFVHIFCHRSLLYPFETEGEKNWMGQYFFTGGQMPSADTLTHFQEDVALEHQWHVSGKHYQQTAQAWLDNLDKNKLAIKQLFKETYGHDQAEIWLQRWRMFFMSCEELFGYRNGEEWLVCHYLFTRR